MVEDLEKLRKDHIRRGSFSEVVYVKHTLDILNIHDIILLDGRFKNIY